MLGGSKVGCWRDWEGIERSSGGSSRSCCCGGGWNGG
jgi:hypothetical protein